jgi:tetratricopeptide (TPR) repeat protein
LGRCLWNLGQFDAAKDRYARALELDTLRFRADSSINRIIRGVGESKAGQGIYFVDAAGVFEQQSPHDCPGLEFFFEHVHLTFSGNYLLAKTVFDRIEQILPDRIKAQRAAEALLPSEDVCAERLAFTDYDNLRITQGNLKVISEKPPFTNQAYREETTNIWKQKVEQLKNRIGPAALDKALEQYDRAIKLDGANRWLRLGYAVLLMDGRNDRTTTLAQYHMLLEQLPQDYLALDGLATLEMMMWDADSSIRHAVMSAELMPTDTLANYTAGAGYQMKGQYKEAQRYFIKAIKWNPKFVQSYIRLGQVLSRQDKIGQAERVYRKGIKAVPDNPQLHLNLAMLLRGNGRLAEAEKERQKAISLDPNIAGQMTNTNRREYPLKQGVNKRRSSGTAEHDEYPQQQQRQ